MLGRRLPTSIYREDDQPLIPNGTVDHALDMSDKTSDTSHNTSSSSEPDEKPRLREWEKHKAPWLEEMKANQAKRTSTSPGPPTENRIKLTPTSDVKSEDKEESTPPPEKEVSYREKVFMKNSTKFFKKEVEKQTILRIFLLFVNIISVKLYTLV